MISLKTHSVYPEIDVSPHNVFTAILYNDKGEVMFEDIGAGRDRKHAIEKAVTLLNEEAEKYKLGE